MKIFITGVSGQLGYDLMKELLKRGCECYGSDIRENSYGFDNYICSDITDKEDIQSAITKVRPDAVIHCAAWTAVDAAEDEKNKALVKKINTDGTRYIAEICSKLNIKMMYISTDYVFNGKGVNPWNPDCKEFAPQNYYGETKLNGELAVSNLLFKYFIVRIAWVFGNNGNNFVKTMLNLADKGFKELNIVDDQIGTPTYTHDLARLLADMIMTDKYGYYHATNEGGYISWADFAEEIFKQARKDVKVVRVTTEEYGGSKAKRPLNSRLDKIKLVQNGFDPLPNWKDAVVRYLKELEKQG